MKIILLTGLAFTVVLASLQERRRYSEPCQSNIVLKNDQGFTKKHIIQTDFDLNSQDAWKRYLKDQGLWCRTPTQSFLPAASEKDVRQICSPEGVRVKSNVNGNLCASKSDMLLYQVVFSRKCRMSVTKKRMFVIVACSMVGRQCRPVHYEGNPSLRRTKQKCVNHNVHDP